MSKNRKTPIWVWVLIIIFIVAFIIIFIASAGNVNIAKGAAPEEFKDDKEQAKHRHEKLKALIEQQEKAFTKLTKRFKWAYFFVRFTFIFLWAAFIFALYKISWVQNLEDALNYSEAIILVGIALNFLTFGTISNLNNFIDLIKMKLENWIWGKHINISVSIAANKTELKELDAS